ncbi:MAG: sulfate adenylyltransferase subunit CysN [Bacteroidales bacterium]|nr:sulfate adenylyltransferase subunit CysN [Bacteroidales bacterium]
MTKRDKNLDIREFLDQDQQKDLLRLLTAGSVDDGKSTLIGRLMFDSKALYEDQLSTLEKDSKRIGHAGDNIDYALLLDGLKAEREQGITIDVAYRYFSTAKRKFIIADTPGHEQYTRNMITGGSTANLAIILVDATKGVITQTRRHTFLVSLLGIKHVALAVNKMDLVDYSQEVFDSICKDYRNFVTQLDIPDVEFFPLSALKGDNVVDKSPKTEWYNGKSLLEFLENVHVGSDRNYNDFRLPVQYVLRPDHKFRGFSGKIASGIIKPGDTVMALPSRKTSKVVSIPTYDGDLEKAFPPQSVTLVLEDEIDISRGEMLVKPDNLPRIERHFESMIVWMDEEPMDVSTQFFLKQNTNTTRARIDMIRHKIDVNTLEKSQVEGLALNEIGRAVLTTAKPLFFDPYINNKNTGSFVLINPVTNNTVAVGMILDKMSVDDLPTRITDIDKRKIENGIGLIDNSAYIKQYNQKGETIWITGLHGAGKNALAYSLEKRLFDLSAIVVTLDGSTIRSGLSRELDFSPADRAEHLRRVAHIAKILNDQGIITICSFISPSEDIRNQCAQIIGPERFHLVHIDADIKHCKLNKPDLYKKAEEGKVKYMPGVSATYEPPTNAAITIEPQTPATDSTTTSATDSTTTSATDSPINGIHVEQIMEYLSERKIFPVE